MSQYDTRRKGRGLKAKAKLPNGELGVSVRIAFLALNEIWNDCG